MELKKLEAMLQVAKDKAEAERLAWEEEREAEILEILELRQTTADLRKETETSEARHGSSELGSLRDDDSGRNSIRRAMSGSSEKSQGVVEDSLTSDR